MKVLIAHNEYKISGGEETAVSNKIKILKENGIQVKVFSKNNIFINSVIKQIAVAFSSIFSFKVAKEFDRILEEYNPDIIEVHNFFPLMSPSIFYIANNRKWWWMIKNIVINFIPKIEINFYINKFS